VSIIGTYASTIMTEASDDDQSLDRTSGRPMTGGRRRQRVGWWRVRRGLGGAAKAAVVSDGEDLPDDGDGDGDYDGGDDDDDGDDDDRAINSSDTAAAAATADDDEGMPRKTLVTAMIRRKTDAADDDIPEEGASNGPTMKLRQYSSLTFEASAPPRSGCS
jgi:hypothetical protein